MSIEQVPNNLATESLNSQISTLIIDDYQEAIDNLKVLLSKFEDVKVVAEANCVEDGIRQIICHKPKLLFLDVEMPPKSGFDLILELMKHQIHCPKIIFTTAYGHYAIDAIRHNALDYLLKPVNSLELAMAIERFRSLEFRQNNAQQVQSLNRLVNRTKRIMLPTITGLKQILVNNVMYFQKDNNVTEHVKVYYNHTQFDTIPGSLTLKQVIAMLPAEDFYQINRQTVINLDYLTNIETKPRICILEKCGELMHLPISRGRLKAFRETMALTDLG